MVPSGRLLLRGVEDIDRRSSEDFPESTLELGVGGYDVLSADDAVGADPLVFCWWNGLVGDLFRTDLKWAYVAIVAAWSAFLGIGRIACVQRYESLAEDSEEEDDALRARAIAEFNQHSKRGASPNWSVRTM